MTETNIKTNSAQQALSTDVEEDASHPTAKRLLWRRLVGLIWDSVEGDKRNRRYVQKIDGILLYVTSLPV